MAAAGAGRAGAERRHRGLRGGRDDRRRRSRGSPRRSTTGALEVIVVDDGSDDGTGSIAERAGATRAARGPAAGRRPRERRGSSCRPRRRSPSSTPTACPEPGWAAAGLAALGRGAELVQGRVRPDPAARLGPFDRTLWVDGDVGLYQTANLFISRAAYEPPAASRPGSGPTATLAATSARTCCSAGRRGAPEPVPPSRTDARRPPRGLPARTGSATSPSARRLAYFPELVRRVPELRERPLFAPGLPELAHRRLRPRRGRGLRSPPSAAAAGRRRWRRSRTRPACSATRRAPRAAAASALVLAADLAADAVGLAALARGSAREPERGAVSTADATARPLRVLTVGNMYPPHHLGGAELIWRSAVEHMRARGWRVRVLTSDWRAPDPDLAFAEDADIARTLPWYWREHDFPRLSARERLRIERRVRAVLDAEISTLRARRRLLVVDWAGCRCRCSRRPRAPGCRRWGCCSTIGSSTGPRSTAGSASAAVSGRARRALAALSGIPAERRSRAARPSGCS